MANKKRPLMHVTIEDHGTAGLVVDWQTVDHMVHEWVWVDGAQLPEAKNVRQALARTFRRLGCGVLLHSSKGDCGHYPKQQIRRRSGKGVI